MNRKGKRTVMMVFGALTAIVIVFTQLFLYQGQDLPQDEVKTEKTEKPSGEQLSIAPLSDTVLSSFHAGIHHEPVFLFEILFAWQNDTDWTPEIPVSLGKYFLTLFHIIISPNAP